MVFTYREAHCNHMTFLQTKKETYQAKTINKGHGDEYPFNIKVV